MTRLSAAMVARLATVPDDGLCAPVDGRDERTLDALFSRGLVTAELLRDWCFGYRRTPFGRETAERLRRRAEK